MALELTVETNVAGSFLVPLPSVESGRGKAKIYYLTGKMIEGKKDPN